MRHWLQIANRTPRRPRAINTQKRLTRRDRLRVLWCLQLSVCLSRWLTLSNGTTTHTSPLPQSTHDRAWCCPLVDIILNTRHPHTHIISGSLRSYLISPHSFIFIYISLPPCVNNVSGWWTLTSVLFSFARPPLLSTLTTLRVIKRCYSLVHTRWWGWGGRGRLRK